MTRSGAIVALTVAAVLAAGGTAAALNARILDPSPTRPIGTVDSVVPSSGPSDEESPADLGSPTGVALTPAPDGSDDDSPSAAASAGRTTARAQSGSDDETRSSSRTSSPRASSSKPRPSHSESESDDDSHDGSPEPSESEHDD